jgi:hypothetical protein
MKKLIFSFSIILCCVFAAQSQTSYKTAIGLRLGYPTSVSFKHFINEKGAVELFAGIRRWSWVNAFNIGGMYEHHSVIADVEGLKWYFGGGASVWLWTYDNDYNFGATYGNTNIAIMGCLGLDYKFNDIPLNLSVDWVPGVIVGDAYYGGFRAGYGALSARYVLK